MKIGFGITLPMMLFYIERLALEAGAHEYLSVPEVERLQEASRMFKEPHQCEVVNGILCLDIALPPHTVAAITVKFVPAQAGGGAFRHDS